MKTLPFGERLHQIRAWVIDLNAWEKTNKLAETYVDLPLDEDEVYEIKEKFAKASAENGFEQKPEDVEILVVYQKLPWTNRDFNSFIEKKANYLTFDELNDIATRYDELDEDEKVKFVFLTLGEGESVEYAFEHIDDVIDVTLDQAIKDNDEGVVLFNGYRFIRVD